MVWKGNPLAERLAALAEERALPWWRRLRMRAV
jgi:hypothetical protein